MKYKSIKIGVVPEGYFVEPDSSCYDSQSLIKSETFFFPDLDQLTEWMKKNLKEINNKHLEDKLKLKQENKRLLERVEKLREFIITRMSFVTAESALDCCKFLRSVARDDEEKNVTRNTEV